MLMLLGIIACSQDEVLKEQLSVDQVDHWCQAAQSGSQGERAWQHDLANAHVAQRMFGPQPDWLTADSVLAEELLGVTDGSDWIEGYADRFEHLCFLSASEEAGPTVIEQVGAVTVIQPGRDAVELPAGTERLLIDLRSVSAGADVASAVGLAFNSDQSLGVRKLRRFLSFPSQEEGWTHYESNTVERALSLVGRGESELQLSFLTGPKLTPEAATIVASLRVQEKATLLGYDLFAAVAESTWSGIEDSGLMWRSSELLIDGELLPDRLYADQEVATVEEALDVLGAVELRAQDGEVMREGLGFYDREAGMPTGQLGDGERRAALLIAYGTLDWFYPYFEHVGRGIDQALLDQWEVLDGLEDGDRRGMMHALGRLMHSIHDGHGFYSDWWTSDWPDGYLGIQIERIDNEPVVRTSVHPDILAGDTIIEIDGEPASSWYEEAMTRYSASSDGYRFVQASSELKEVYGTRALTLQAPDGVEREVQAGPQDYYTTMDVPWGGTKKESGWLDDMAAPTIFYVNMSGEVTPDMEPITDQFDELLGADGIILDMRDYPYLDIYEFARYFNPGPFSAPHFGFPTWTGPESYELTFEIWDFWAGSQVYEGPVVLMVSNKTVSAAECFAQMLVPQDNVVVVGQQSASTNGTITNAWLPGQLQITWTGMDLRNLDGSDFHGIGIVPEHIVEPTAADFAAGEDPELNRALELLGQ